LFALDLKLQYLFFSVFITHMAGEGFPNRWECHVVFMGRSSESSDAASALGETKAVEPEPATSTAPGRVKERGNDEVSDGNPENCFAVFYKMTTT